GERLHQSRELPQSTGGRPPAVIGTRGPGRERAWAASAHDCRKGSTRASGQGIRAREHVPRLSLTATSIYAGMGENYLAFKYRTAWPSNGGVKTCDRPSLTTVPVLATFPVAGLNHS